MQFSVIRSSRIRSLRFLLRCALLLILSPIAAHSQSRTQDITCDGGSGEYSTQFSTGVTVFAGPARKGAFADRACEAKLSWKGVEISVVSDAGQVGIDVLGANLGFGKPVVSFQIDKSGGGSDREYEIYSLAKPARLLYTLTGGDSYSAGDTDMDGHVEIWTDDAAAVDGFERIPRADFDFAPPIVLRFNHGRPLDVGSEFISYYDDLIARTRSQISSSDLADFKLSDGKLSVSSAATGERLHRLIRTKIGVLEIVLAYLYSGREQEAWAAIAEMWPENDSGRIKQAVLALYGRGILHNMERSSRSARKKRHVMIYDAINASPVVTAYDPYSGAPDPSQSGPNLVQPKSILLRRPPSSPDGGFPSANETVELVVDSAGKVRSAHIVNGTDISLVKASSGWHFIPAFHDGVPVACRFRLSVWTLK